MNKFTVFVSVSLLAFMVIAVVLASLQVQNEMTQDERSKAAPGQTLGFYLSPGDVVINYPDPNYPTYDVKLMTTPQTDNNSVSSFTIVFNIPKNAGLIPISFLPNQELSQNGNSWAVNFIRIDQGLNNTPDSAVVSVTDTGIGGSNIGANTLIGTLRFNVVGVTSDYINLDFDLTKSQVFDAKNTSNTPMANGVDVTFQNSKIRVNTPPTATPTTIIAPSATPTSAIPTPTPNLSSIIQNPGFENDLQLWLNSAGISTSTSNIHGGSKAATLGSGAYISQDISSRLTAGVQYNFSAWVRVTTLGTSWGLPSIRLSSFQDLGNANYGTPGSNEAQNSTTLGWQNISVSYVFTQEQLATPVYLGIVNFGFDGVVVVDDFAALNQGSPSPTPTLSLSATPTPKPSDSPTVTPTSVPTFTPTPTPLAQRITYRLEGISQATTANVNPQITLLCGSVNYPVVIEQTNTNIVGGEYNGFLTTFNLPTNPTLDTTCTLYLKTKSHLRRAIPFSTQSYNATTNTWDAGYNVNKPELLVGDLNNDNLITQEDTRVFHNVYKNFSNPISSGNAADVNDDGYVTIVDLALMLFNYKDFIIHGD